MAFVRPVTEGDAAQIVALLNDIIAQGTYTVMDEPLTIADQRAFIRTFPERGVFYAACALDGRLLGIQDIVPPASSQAPEQVGEISTFVRLDARGRGIGSLLTRTTFEAARLKGFERIRAMVRSDNAQALGFYQRQGFRLVGMAESHVRINGRDVDQTLLERLL